MPSLFSFCPSSPSFFYYLYMDIWLPVSFCMILSDTKFFSCSSLHYFTLSKLTLSSESGKFSVTPFSFVLEFSFPHPSDSQVSLSKSWSVFWFSVLGAPLFFLWFSLPLFLSSSLYFLTVVPLVCGLLSFSLFLGCSKFYISFSPFSLWFHVSPASEHSSLCLSLRCSLFLTPSAHSSSGACLTPSFYLHLWIFLILGLSLCHFFPIHDPLPLSLSFWTFFQGLLVLFFSQFNS